MNTLPFTRRNPAPFKIPTRHLGLAVLLTLGLSPNIARACACGCGIYEVGTSSMLPTGSGLMTYFDYDYQDQNHNWSGSSQAPGADNPDKDIRTSFLTLGYQDMFSRSWGLRFEIPYERRYFETTGGATGDAAISGSRGFIPDFRRTCRVGSPSA
jgi:hypothetical protein